jgi:Holliday junction DNA helicase RuvB
MDKFEVLEYLNQHPEYARVLKLAVQHEEKNASEPHYLGWTWADVRAFAATINKLVVDGLVEVTYDSANFTNYKLTNLEAAKEALQEFEALREKAVPEEKAEIPANLFDVIVGYDEVKELFWDAIKSDMPCHILLVGPPASAKSMFLLELSRLPNSHFALGGQTSKVGLADEIFDHSPKYLVIDELDDMPVDEQSVLKSLMWSGVVARRKHRIRQKGTFKTWVFAGSNKLEKLSDPVKSRFMKVHFHPYTFEQFKEVVVAVLTRRENIDLKLAEYIAETIGKHTRDPREAINLARVAKTEEKVDKYVALIWGENQK